MTGYSDPDGVGLALRAPLTPATSAPPPEFASVEPAAAAPEAEALDASDALDAALERALGPAGESWLGAPPPTRNPAPGALSPQRHPHREAFWRDVAARLRDDYLAQRGLALPRAGLTGAVAGTALAVVPRLVRAQPVRGWDTALAAAVGAALALAAQALGLRVAPAGLRSIPPEILDALPEYGDDWQLYMDAIRSEVCGSRGPLALSWGRAKVSAG